VTLAKVIPFPERRVDGEVWEPWVDEAVIARHFGVSARTVRRWAQERGMPSTAGPSGVRRFRVSQCETWFNDGGQR
jgi:hypothetical protein